MILDICEAPEVLRVMRIINIVLTIIRIVVPIILIVSLATNYMYAVRNNDSDALNKANKSAVIKVITAVLVFFIPTFVKLISNVVLSDSKYKNCIVDISEEQIEQSFIDKEEEYVSKAEETLSIDDYNTAIYYLIKIKDSEKRKEFKDRLDKVKELIDESRKKPSNSSLVSSGLGRDIVPTEELITACKWVLNQEIVNIRLQTCPSEEQRYKNPEADLPGGAYESNGRDIAKETISLSEYSKGVFFGEEKIEIAPASRYAYVIIYRTVFVHNTVHYAINAKRDPLEGKEIRYTAGNCAQNYRCTQRRSKYESGKYKAEIDDAVETTKYLILANDDGITTNATYHSYTGIEQQIEKSGKEGQDFLQIIETIKSGNKDSGHYKKAHVYDCRNLYEDGTIEYVVGN